MNTTIDLDGDTLNWKNITLTNPKMYKIDYDKVNTIDDIKNILSVLSITIGDNVKDFDKIEHLLQEV